jgi:hypothetical protein
MRIAFIGKFGKLHDEEYIARSFEMLGHTVIRIEERISNHDLRHVLLREIPDVILFCKWERPKELDEAFALLKHKGTKTVCWLFDLYFNYTREWQVSKRNFFRADVVCTTDGGNDHRWKEFGINHHTVRQGIYKDECFLVDSCPAIDVVFIGSESPVYPERTKTMLQLEQDYNFKWFGRKDTDELRGIALNRLFARSKIVVGDSFYSPNYWSNRVVETLGRGGFLIHREVEGIKEEYPYLVTYDGTYEDLKKMIDYYLSHEDERREIVQKNFEWVRDNYTMDKKCEELLKIL